MTRRDPAWFKPFARLSSCRCLSFCLSFLPSFLSFFPSSHSHLSLPNVLCLSSVSPLSIHGLSSGSPFSPFSSLSLSAFCCPSSLVRFRNKKQRSTHPKIEIQPQPFDHPATIESASARMTVLLMSASMCAHSRRNLSCPSRPFPHPTYRHSSAHATHLTRRNTTLRTWPLLQRCCSKASQPNLRFATRRRNPKRSMPASWK